MSGIAPDEVIEAAATDHPDGIRPSVRVRILPADDPVWQDGDICSTCLVPEEYKGREGTVDCMVFPFAAVNVPGNGEIGPGGFPGARLLVPVEALEVVG